LIERPPAAALAVLLALVGGLMTARGVAAMTKPDPVALAAPTEPTAKPAGAAGQAAAGDPARPAAPGDPAGQAAAGDPAGKAAAGDPARPAAPGDAAGAAAPGAPAAPGDPAKTTTKAKVTGIPTRLDIPSIGVHTRLIKLGLNKDGTVEVPPLDGDAPAGWYTHSAIPGATGPAVMLGHVDSARDGPAVFYRLSQLKPGAEVTVRRSDGSTARFHVTRVARYPKTGFPTADVYGPVPYPALRLVTCGGSFDRNRGSYRDNIVVSAR
jgi:sortase (surface protein transpeptidase)